MNLDLNLSGNRTIGPAAELALFEPADGYMYAGAGQCIESALAMIHSISADRKPVIIALYEGLSSDQYRRNPDIMEAHNVFPGAIVQIGLQLPVHNDSDLAAVGEGGYDRQIEEMADLYKSIALPVFLRIGYEFDGEWNGYDPVLYKRAYRRIVDLFRKRGADNVAYVWNTYIADNRRMMDWYPNDPDTGALDGDGYVDWFSFNTITPNYDAAWFMEQAAARRKPVMIGEGSYAIVQPAYSFAACIGDFMAMLKTHGIKGYQYINWEWQVYPGDAQWHTWANGRYTDYPELVRQYNALMEEDGLIVRDRSYHNPAALFVDCARALKQSDKDGGAWDKRFDHCTVKAGYDYTVDNAIVRYGDGWFPYYESAGGELTIRLRMAAGFSGYFIMNINIGNGASLARDETYAVTSDDGACLIYNRKGGYHKIPIGSTPACEEREWVVRIANTRAGETVKVAQFGLMALPEAPLPMPDHVRIASGEAANEIRWEAVSGALLYNVYKDNQLIGMTKDTYYCDSESERRHGQYAVAAYERHRGEGLMSSLV